MTDRRKEVLSAALDIFITQGISKTTTRDLCNAMNLQNGGMYYYFSSKDELVAACVEEATLRMENSLLCIALDEIRNPGKMMNDLQAKAVELSPMMKFVTSVCSDKRYEQIVKPVLTVINGRYSAYCKRCAEIMNCGIEEITPYVYMLITSLCNYMIFGELSFVSPQMRAVTIKLERLLGNDNVHSQ